jgi:hypothetical protein
MIAPTIATATATRKGGVAFPRNKTSRGDAALAKRLGINAKAASAKVERFRELCRQVAATVASDPTLSVWAATIVAPINYVTAVPTVSELTPEVVLAAQEADLAEDLAEAKYVANPCRETLIALRAAGVRAVDAEKRRIAAIDRELAR